MVPGIVAPIVMSILLSTIDLSGLNDRVTVVLKSGEQLAGQLKDVHDGMLYLDASYYTQPRVLLTDIAMIDFTGQSPRIDPYLVPREGEQVLVWRDGRATRGQFLGVLGQELVHQSDHTLEFAFRGEDGQVVKFTTASAAQLYLGAANGRYTMMNSRPPDIVVPGNQAWVATGIMVREGDYITFSALGTVRLSQDPQDTASPAGSLKRRLAARSPRPRDLAGALLGRVGSTEPFGIGDQTVPLRMPNSGELMLGINDDELRDNSGQFVVSIQATNPRP